METRPIPKSTMIYMVILVILGILTYFLTQNGKSQKVTRILNQLGYTKVANVKVYGITKVEDEVTRVQGFKYFVKFEDLLAHKACKGFVYKDFKQKVDKDIICKDNN